MNKKTISILISTLLLASAFGVGTVMAPIPDSIKQCDLDSPCQEINYRFSRTLVPAGQTFTLTIKVNLTDPETPVYPFFYLFEQPITSDLTSQEKEEIETMFLGYKVPSHLGSAQLLSMKVFYEDGTEWNNKPDTFPGEGEYSFIFTARAVRPGIIHCIMVCFTSDSPDNFCYKVVPVTITPRPLPMHSILRILGISGLMRE